MEQSGGNIASRVGDGDAYVYNWEPIHRQVNQLIQRDIYHQRQMQDVANKASIEMKKAGTSARPEDIPELTNYYNSYRTAGMKLLDPKVYSDPQQRSYWQKMQDESELNYHALANDSKETGKTLAALPLEYAKSGGNGFKPIDEFGQQLQQAKGLSTRQIREQGLDNPISYMGAKELYPAKDYQQHVYGGYESVPVSEPIKNDKGETIAWQEKHIKQPKNPIPVIVHNTVEALNGVPAIHKQVNDAFTTDLQMNEPLVDQTLKNAQDYVSTLPKEQQDHILPYLRKDALGYELSKNLLGPKPEVTLGKQTEDPIYRDRQNKADRWAMFNMNRADKLQFHEDAKNNFKLLHSALLNGNPSNFGLPDADYFEEGLASPDATTNGKTNLEHVSDGLNILNSALTNKSGSGTKLMPMPVFTNPTAEKNQFFKGASEQALQQLKSALSAPVPHGVTSHMSYKAIENAMSSKNNTPRQKLDIIAKAYNQINEENGIAARFTPEDISSVTPVMLHEHQDKNAYNLAEKEVFGVLKPGTPEFRNYIENARQKAFKGIKKFSATQAIGNPEQLTKPDQPEQSKPEPKGVKGFIQKIKKKAKDYGL